MSSQNLRQEIFQSNFNSSPKQLLGYQDFNIDKNQNLEFIVNSPTIQKSIVHLKLKVKKNIAFDRVCQAIPLCQNLEKLSISSQLSKVQIEQLFQILSSHQKLITLELRQCPQNEESIYSLQSVLKLLNLKNITVYQLWSNIFEIYDIYGDAILQNKNLNTIYLDFTYGLPVVGFQFLVWTEEPMQKKWNNIFKRNLKKLVTLYMQFY